MAKQNKDDKKKETKPNSKDAPVQGKKKTKINPLEGIDMKSAFNKTSILKDQIILEQPELESQTTEEVPVETKPENKPEAVVKAKEKSEAKPEAEVKVERKAESETKPEAKVAPVKKENEVQTEAESQLTPNIGLKDFDLFFNKVVDLGHVKGVKLGEHNAERIRLLSALRSSHNVHLLEQIVNNWFDLYEDDLKKAGYLKILKTVKK